MFILRALDPVLGSQYFGPGPGPLGPCGRNSMQLTRSTWSLEKRNVGHVFSQSGFVVDFVFPFSNKQNKIIIIIIKSPRNRAIHQEIHQVHGPGLGPGPGPGPELGLGRAWPPPSGQPTNLTRVVCKTPWHSKYMKNLRFSYGFPTFEHTCLETRYFL